MPDGIIGVFIGILIAPVVYFFVLLLIWGIAEMVIYSKKGTKKKGPFV